ncbi:GAF domain-containing sensor histidine kinase [Terrabacter sp. BE26]|uniref:sensor histidine kinase n=1 Tax=Terrabacter sp. BE26 TaxID=2898152 RepID=UPI0035BE507C
MGYDRDLHDLRAGLYAPDGARGLLMGDGAEPAAGSPGSAEDRLRSLLAANRSVVSELTLSAVLRRIVEAARDVAGARFAALGVVGADGRLEEFVHSGMEDSSVAHVGHPPTGEGILGLLIEQPQPLRLHAITDDARSVGFPPGHPMMRAFLGVPVLCRGEVFGNLYLADRVDGTDFTDDDEELVVALAASAGVAIENARLYEESRRRQEWLRASAEISSDLLRPGLGSDVLVRIADAMLRLADADVVTLDFPEVGAVPGATGEATGAYAVQLVVEVARGPGADDLVGTAYPAERSLAGVAMRERRAVVTGPSSGRSSDASSDAVTLAAVAGRGPCGPAMACPLAGEAGVRGVVVMGRRKGAPVFARAEAEMAEQLANHAAMALELADGRADEERIAVLEDRQRIARDLHDHVIQRIFATGLSLEAVRGRAIEPTVRETLSRAVEDLDGTIRRIRSAIFELQVHPASRDARAVLLEVMASASAGLGFEPALRLDGPVATALEPALLHDVTAVLREGLTNVVKHSHCSAVDVHVAVSDNYVTVEVSDDGPLANGGSVDAPARPRRQHESGLANLARRARARHGDCILTTNERVTVLTWTARLTDGGSR